MTSLPVGLPSTTMACGNIHSSILATQRLSFSPNTLYVNISFECEITNFRPLMLKYRGISCLFMLKYRGINSLYDRTPSSLGTYMLLSTQYLFLTFKSSKLAMPYDSPFTSPMVSLSFYGLCCEDNDSNEIRKQSSYYCEKQVVAISYPRPFHILPFKAIDHIKDTKASNIACQFLYFVKDGNTIRLPNFSFHSSGRNHP